MSEILSGRDIGGTGDAPNSGAIPPSLERFGPLLQAAIARDLGSRPTPQSTHLVRSRPGWRLAGAGALGVVALAAVLVAGGAFGGGPFVARAAAAEAAAVLQDVPAGSIMHIRTVGSQANPDGSVVTWEDESWRSTSAPFAARGIERAPDSPIAETAIDPSGYSFLFDASTNTIYRSPDTSAPGFTSPDEGFRSEALAMLTSGTAKVDGHETVGGRDALRIVSGDGHATYLVDPKTYDPIEWRTTGDGGGATLTFAAFEVLPGTASNLALIDIAAQHPGATLDTSASDYRDAMARLYPHG